MRNLKIISWVESSIVEDIPITATAWDTSSTDIIFTCGPTPERAVISLKRSKLQENIPTSNKFQDNTSFAGKVQTLATWDAPCPLPDLACDRILSLYYFSEDQTTCIVLEGGDVVVVRENANSKNDKIEIVGSVDAGITAAAWSPDEALLAISTREDTFLFMTRDYDNLSDLKCSPEDLKISKHVSVGWGKAETQFKGKRAKALRDPTIPEKIDEGLQSSCDDGAAVISWRGDGAFVALSTLDPNRGRVIRVYSREGALDSVSEPVDRLEGALSWRPAGNLIASVQRSPDSANVVFFERNGLRHGQFSLRLTEDDLKGWARNVTLSWNIDSSVLAVTYLDRVQLWTMGNYHYYLKQEVPLMGALELDSIKRLIWHPEKPFQFAFYSGKRIIRLEFEFAIIRGPSSPPHDHGTVAVIDGKVLKLSHLRYANVPPPMACNEIEFPSTIVDAAVSQDGLLLAVLLRRTVRIFRMRPKAVSKLSVFPLADNNIGENSTETRRIRLCFAGNSKLIVSFLTTTESTVCVYSIAPDANAKMMLNEWSKVIPMSVTHLLMGPASEDFHVVSGYATSTIHTGRWENGKLSLGDPVSFPSRCSWVETVKWKDQLLVFGLTSAGVLYANERILTRNCTSFLVAPSHIILTTAQHLLKFVHIDEVNALEVPSDSPETDERCRTIERGAKLVTVVPSNFSLTLQMPRGNLETIFPRALVLAGIRRSISATDYKTAFFTCRNHRVDMNILHDYDSKQFMGCIGLFIEQVPKSEHIDLFLSSLREEDVTQTMYQNTLHAMPDLERTAVLANGYEVKEAASADQGKPSKVNRICDGFLDALKHKSVTNLHSIITAHVCKSPPDLDAGLLAVNNLLVEESEDAERALEHLCFLADVNRLYHSALGLYNLNLALEVAQKSQMDPREYLPFLQNLEDMPEGRRRLTIDDHLGYHEKAISHLYQMKAHEELKEYTVKHKLYLAALRLYRYDEEQLNATTHLYAIYLEKDSQYYEAGLAFEFLNLYAEASEAYRAAGNWRECLFCASQTSMSSSEREGLASALANVLYEAKDYPSAATIYLEYKNDVEAATRSLCKGYYFAEAMRILSVRDRLDLLEPIIDMGMTEGLGNSTEFLAECKGQLQAQVPRLRELRAKKEEDPLNFYDAPANPDADIPDDVSIAPSALSTSGGSLLTRYTGRNDGSTLATNTSRRTSKNARREERKRARGKKGSVYEEEYLVNSIRRLIERVSGTKDEVKRLVAGLVRREMRERARAVEDAMKEVTSLCQACLDEVFGEERKVEAEKAEGISGADRVFAEGMREKEKRGQRPVVELFERLSLLEA